MERIRHDLLQSNSSKMRSHYKSKSQKKKKLRDIQNDRFVFKEKSLRRNQIANQKIVKASDNKRRGDRDILARMPSEESDLLSSSGDSESSVDRHPTFAVKKNKKPRKMRGSRGKGMESHPRSDISNMSHISGNPLKSKSKNLLKLFLVKLF